MKINAPENIWIEVDLEKEIDLVEDKYHGFESLSRADIIEIIKHFFELGLNAQKENSMTKAENRALEAYPSTSHYWNAEPDRNAEAREFYKQGYQQAEKDLELNWKDINNIKLFTDQVECDYIEIDKKLYTKDFYEEVLKQFKAQKGE